MRFGFVFEPSKLHKSSPLSTRMRFRLSKSSPLSIGMRFLFRKRHFGAFLRFDLRKTAPLSTRMRFSKVSEPSALCKSSPLSAIMRFRPSKTAPLSTRIRFCFVFAPSELRKSSPLSTRMRFRLAKSSPLSTRMRFLLRNRRFGAFLRFDFQTKAPLCVFPRVLSLRRFVNRHKSRLEFNFVREIVTVPDNYPFLASEALRKQLLSSTIMSFSSVCEPPGF